MSENKKVKRQYMILRDVTKFLQYKNLSAAERLITRESHDGCVDVSVIAKYLDEKAMEELQLSHNIIIEHETENN